MVINTNTAAQAAANNLVNSQANLAKSLARLSSGTKIINPSDDAAGLAVSSRLDAQINRIGAAQSNISNAISYTQTQDSYLSKVAKALDRMSELSILAQDTTKGPEDIKLYNNEFQQLASFITNTATKDFNGVSLFSPSVNLDVTIDSEANPFTMASIDLSIAAYTDVAGSPDGSTTSLQLTDSVSAKAALLKIETAITQLSNDRATIGATQTRLNLTMDQLTVNKENLTAASSRIKDVDMAEESTQYSKENILVQTGTAMLAQANQMPQSVLRLLQ